jgi:hypothetical protein
MKQGITKRRFASAGALPFTFVLYVVEAAAALVFALPLGLELRGDVRASLTDAIGRAIWLDRVAELVPVVRAQVLSAGLGGLLWLVLSPWLQMAWLSALARPCSVRAALRDGARLYLRAWGVSLWVLALLALAGLPGGAALWFALWAFSGHAEAHLYDIALAAACVALVPLLWTAHVLHDLARARALSASAWTAVRSSLRNCLRLRIQASALAFLLASCALRATHALVHVLGPGLAGIAAVALLQAACLGALLARGAWLSRALACAGELPASRDLA